jgi:hypothetical protein
METLFSITRDSKADRKVGQRRPIRRSVQRAWLLGSVCLILIDPTQVAAKRGAPPEVDPVTAKGITYSAPAQFMGYVVATDAQSHRELWRERIYTVKIKPTLERDVQDVFITSLAVQGAVLIVANERGERFSLNLSSRKVTRLK